MERKSKVIDGRTFELAPLPGRRGNRVFTKLVKRFGGGLAGALSGDVSGLQALFSAIDPQEFDEVLEELVRGGSCTMDGAMLWPRYDAEFAGEIGRTMQLFGFALEVNFGSFRDGLLAKLGERAKAFLSTSPSTSAPTGESGASSSSASQP
jgi:hypothetical protein